MDMQDVADAPVPGNSIQSMFSRVRKDDDDLIQIVNDLQDKLTATGQSLNISLPQIVAVGCQSAGKSSVLENIVGKEFLPRGSGVVTRRPTIVQLNPCDKEYAVFLHRPEDKITDFEEIKKEITAETLRDPGRTGFSSTPINLQIFSPNGTSDEGIDVNIERETARRPEDSENREGYQISAIMWDGHYSYFGPTAGLRTPFEEEECLLQNVMVLKLTLVDLPGLVKIPIGDQSENVVDEVREMVIKYISQPKCLILAVSPANQDIANSDSLNIAKLVDPERERTIGVLTKLDLMDKGTNGLAILENRVVPLKRGYVGVVNRSQQDIDEKKGIQYSLANEKKFFEQHQQYKHLASCMGTKYLQTLLHKQLKNHIRVTLPDVRNELDSKYVMCRKELDTLNHKLGELGRSEKRIFMVKLVHQFVERLKLQLIGQSELVDVKTLNGGARINYLLYTEIQEYLNLELVPDSKDLIRAIANISGFRTSFSVPSLAFDAECRLLMEKFKRPLEKAVETVVRELNTVVTECAEEVDVYPSLKQELIYRVNNCIRLQEKATKDVLKSHVEAEMNYINMGHPDFEVSILQQVAPQAGPVKIWDEKPPSLPDGDDSKGKENVSESKKDEESSSHDVNSRITAPDVLLDTLLCSAATQRKATYVSALIMKYLEIVRKTISDVTIKYIMFYLVKSVLDFAKVELIARLVDSANIDCLMAEREDDIQRQERLESTCSAINYALDAIRDF